MKVSDPLRFGKRPDCDKIDLNEASPDGEALKPLKAGAGSPGQRSGAESEVLVKEHG